MEWTWKHRYNFSFNEFSNKGGGKGTRAEGKGDTAMECQENVLLLISIAVMILCILNVFFRGRGGRTEDTQRLRLCPPASIGLGISHIPFFFIINPRTRDPAAQKEG